MSEIITCRPGQSCMAAAREAGLAIHLDSPTPGLSAAGVEQWARERGITLAAIVRVRRDECFAAVAPGEGIMDIETRLASVDGQSLLCEDCAEAAEVMVAKTRTEAAESAIPPSIYNALYAAGMLPKCDHQESWVLVQPQTYGGIVTARCSVCDAEARR